MQNICILAFAFYHIFFANLSQNISIYEIFAFLAKFLRSPQKTKYISNCLCSLTKEKSWKKNIEKHCKNIPFLQNSLAEETKVSWKVLQANAKILKGNATYLQEKAKVLQANTKALKYNLSSHHHVPSVALYIFIILQT